MLTTLAWVYAVGFIGVFLISHAPGFVGLTQSRGLLDLSIFRQGMGTPDFSPKNFTVNVPHIVLAGIALVFGFRKSPTLARSAA